MKIVLLTSWKSPHLLPLANELAKVVGEASFRYHYLEPPPPNHVVWGWDKLGKEAWCQQGTLEDAILEEADILLSGLRLPKLFEVRAAKGKKTYYVSERWFKPPLGILRLLHPGYLKMAWQLCQNIKKGEMTYLPIGIYAARDMARLMGLFSGDLWCLFRAPKVAFESRPGGGIVSLKEAIRVGVLSQEEIAFGKKYGFVQIPKQHWNKLTPSGMFAKMKMWGYFVAPSNAKRESHALPVEHPKRVLWVGRLLDLKRVDVLVRAVSPHPDLKRVDVSLQIYGNGPERERLCQLAKNAPNIEFHDFVPIDVVRKLMRQHDIYVLSSNGYEGWGAVVSEALEESMKVLGTIEAGSSATILPPANLFKAGDVKRLREFLQGEIATVDFTNWTAESAAQELLLI